MHRTKTCRWCEWFTCPPYPGAGNAGECRFNPIIVRKYAPELFCGRFQWNEEAMQEMLAESEKKVKDSLDFSSKGKG